MSKNNRLWIQRAVEGNKGKLREDIQEDYGKEGFTKRGTIKVSTLKKASKHKTPKLKKDSKMAKRARLALTLRGLRKKKM